MSDIPDYTDVLELNASDTDISDMEETNELSESRLDKENNQQKCVNLKIFKKGVSLIPDFCGDMLKHLIIDNKLDIGGIFFDAGRSVWIEVSENIYLLKYLTSLFEKRHGMSLNEKTKKKNDLLSIFNGRFEIEVRGTTLFLIVSPHNTLKLVPCQATNGTLGLVNDVFINIKVGEFSTDYKTAMADTFVASWDKFVDLLSMLIGLRLEKDDDGSLSIRLMLKFKFVRDSFISLLNERFGNVRFCSSTMHLIPSILFNPNFSHTSAAYLNFILKNDLILRGYRENNSSNKHNASNNVPAPLPAININIGKVKINIKTSNKAEEPKTNQIKSIFQRLGPKINVEDSEAVSTNQELEPSTSSINLRKVTSKKQKLMSVVVIPPKKP